MRLTRVLTRTRTTSRIRFQSVETEKAGSKGVFPRWRRRLDREAVAIRDEECEDQALLAASCSTSIFKLSLQCSAAMVRNACAVLLGASSGRLGRGKNWPQALAITLGWLVLGCLAPTLGAAQTDPALALTNTGLPGVSEVPLLTPEFESLTLAAGTNYGFTDAALDRGDHHHRVGLQLAGAWAPLPQLAIGLQLAGRYDGHRNGDDSTDSGILARPKVFARGRFKLSGDYYLGGQIAWQPAPTSDLNTALSRGALGLSVLGGAEVARLSLGGRLGLRFDGGKQALESLSTLSDNDKLALGISSAPELLIGISGLYALQDDLGVIGELTWDIPLGKNSLSPLAAPLWLRGGARWAVVDDWSLGGIVGISPSRRDGLPSGNTLARVDPRIYVGLTLGYSVLSGDNDETQRSEPKATDSPASRLASVHVTGVEGTTVEAAEIRSGSGTCRTDGSGSCTLELNASKLSVTAAGYLTQELAVAEIYPDALAPSGQDSLPTLDVALRTAPITLTGQILDDNGLPVANGRISVMRGDRQRDIRSNSAGRFSLPGLAPGPVVLRVEAEGLQAHERLVTLVPNHPDVTLAPQAKAASGQVRGTVRTFDGNPLRATIKISPGGKRLQSDADGTFRLDLPPGNYNVTVQAVGYRPQKREAIVEAGGVAVLLVELQSRP